MWSRLPMRSPILGRLASVSSRARYMARCRLSTTGRERLSPVISVTEMPVDSATAERMSVDGDAGGGRLGDVLQHLAGELDVDGALGEGRVSHHAGETALQAPGCWWEPERR